MRIHSAFDADVIPDALSASLDGNAPLTGEPASVAADGHGPDGGDQPLPGR